MLYDVYDYTYSSSSAQLVQGKTIPKNTVGGSNGSYIAVAEKAQIILHTKSKDTGVGPDIDIAPRARFVAFDKGMRLSKKRANDLGKYFVGKTIDVDKDRNIKNIDSMIYGQLK